MASGRSLQRMKPILPSQNPALHPEQEPTNGVHADESNNQEMHDDEEVQPAGRVEYIERQDASFKADDSGEKTQSNVFQQYTVRVPVTKEGLHLVLDEVDGAPCVTGYRTFENGELSPLMRMKPRPFKTGKDQIVAIDNIPLVDKTYDEVIDLLLDNNNKRVRVFRMRTRKDM